MHMWTDTQQCVYMCMSDDIQLTLNNTGLNCYSSTYEYMWNFFNKYVQYCKCILSYDFLDNIFFSLLNSKNNSKYMICITYKMCVN